MLVIPYDDDNPTGKTPYVTYTLIIINTLLFLGLGFTSAYRGIVESYGFVPSVAAPVTYLTSIFLHGGIFHLIGNMLYLYIVGDNIEDRLGHIGFIIFYLISGALANVFHMYMIPKALVSTPVIGASGAISAVLGAYLLLFPRNKIKFFYFFIIFIIIRWGTFKVASFWAIGLWFVMQFISHTFSRGVSSVAYGAHIGGFIVGVLFVGFFILIGRVNPYWHKEHDYADVERESGVHRTPENISTGIFGGSRQDTYRVTGFNPKDQREDDYW